MTRPRCYNRPPRDEGRWVQNGYRPSDLKPRLRWSPRWFVDRCATWDGTGIGPNGEPYPIAHGWDCFGCRWDPRRRADGLYPLPNRRGLLVAKVID